MANHHTPATTTPATTAAPGHADHGGHGVLGHVDVPGTLFVVFLAILGLFALTVWMSSTGRLGGYTLFAQLGSDGYVAVMAYLDRLADASLADVRPRIAAHTGRPTTFGWGPRFLHSTGQFHKGGPATGVVHLERPQQAEIGSGKRERTGHLPPTRSLIRPLTASAPALPCLEPGATAAHQRTFPGRTPGAENSP